MAKLIDTFFSTDAQDVLRSVLIGKTITAVTSVNDNSLAIYCCEGTSFEIWADDNRLAIGEIRVSKADRDVVGGLLVQRRKESRPKAEAEPTGELTDAEKSNLARQLDALGL